MSGYSLEQAKIDIANLQTRMGTFDRAIKATPGLLTLLNNGKVKGDLEVVGALTVGSGLSMLEFHPLSTPLTSTSWDGDAFSTNSRTAIDLNSVFSVPAGAKAVSVFIQARDSGSYSSNPYFLLAPTETAEPAVRVWMEGRVNDKRETASGIVPCDTNGNIWFENLATGTGTMDIWIIITGYWI